MPVYLPGDTPIGGAYPAILAVGDSWFWYPKNNILQALSEHPALKDPYRNIQVLGYNGAAMAEYVDRNNIRGRYAREFQYQLSPNQSSGYSAVMISGGGNDAVNYRLALRGDCTGIKNADECMDPAGLGGLIDDITGALDLMLYEIARTFVSRPRPVDVFIHGYDYPVPDGRPFTLAGLRFMGPWLKPALDAARVDPADMDLRKAVCRNLIDALNRAFESYDNQAQAVHYINSRGVLGSGADYTQDWDNELHPTFAGFKSIIDQRWIPVLAREGYATA